MLSPLRYVILALTRLVVGLRYRLQVRGLEQLDGRQGPILILPNHPGLMDPVLVFAALWPRLRPRPMVYEGNFSNPLLRLLMNVMNALWVPDLDQASAQARSRAEEAVASVIEGLKKGENHILWPSGQTQHDGIERLGGARAAADILTAVPEATLVLVRTRGLWGSMFGYAPTGEHPDLVRRLLAGAGWLLANLLVFAPRRPVTITVERIDPDRLPPRRREVLNPWLEAWFNEGGPEKPTYVPYHLLLGPRTFEFPTRVAPEEVDPRRIKPATREAVNHIVSDRLGRPLAEAEDRADTTLDQLGLDSLDRMELSLQVEQRFGFTGDDVPATLGQLWALGQGLARKAALKPPPPDWFRSAARPDEPTQVLGDTIAAAFVNRALACRRDVAVADDLAGVLTYERLLVSALVLSRRFTTLPGTNVGLLLPASVACDSSFLGLQLAGKVPVVLNWTTGPANLAHAARLMGLSHVITSKAFIDRTGIVVEGTQYLFLEELRKGIGKVELLRTLLGVRWLPGTIRGRLPQPAPDQPAVVLFTSGSEKAPKAVPLTHSNILSNHRTGVPFLGLKRTDSFLGFLPAFHSFGMSVTGLLPILNGLRVVHHPDPTDAGGLARKAAAYRTTLLVGTPTFVSYILEHASAEDLKSLRLIIVGAEKCPPQLRDRCTQLAPHAHLLEGYGITECSPVVSSNRVEANRFGTLGQALPGVETCVVDLETDAILPRNQMGMLLISGPTVFPGYIGHDGPPPFRDLDGKRWYITGDLVHIDDDGFIHFDGRLKRFLKAGGEMISLPALEEPFARLYPPTKDGPRVAVEGVESEDGRRIVLFTTELLNVRDANARLMEEGFRGVMRLDEVRQIEHIPVLGTGKTDYKALRAMLVESERPAGVM